MIEAWLTIDKTLLSPQSGEASETWKSSLTIFPQWITGEAQYDASV